MQGARRGPGAGRIRAEILEAFQPAEQCLAGHFADLRRCPIARHLYPSYTLAAYYVLANNVSMYIYIYIYIYYIHIYIYIYTIALPIYQL